MKTISTSERGSLLQRVSSIASILASDVEEAERISNLPPNSVAALRSSGLYGLKTPRVLGGLEASLGDQLAVFEELAYISPSASWNLFVSTAGLGIASAHLSDVGVETILKNGEFPTFSSGGGYILGSLVPDHEGYRLSGRWIYGSGIRHADWVAVPARVETGNPASVDVMTCVVPGSAFEIHDTWKVVGLKGSGSHDYSVNDVFVSKEMTYKRSQGPLRGGAIFYLGNIGFVTVEIAGFMIGVARRALDELIKLSINKSRGYVKQTSLAHRQVLQRAVAEADMKLKAVRALNLELSSRAMAAASGQQMVRPELEVELRAASTLASECAIDVVNMAFRYAAGTALRLDESFQRCLRDIHAAGTHFIVSDTSLESHGKNLLGIESADVMA